MLELTGVHAGYGTATVLRGIDLNVDQGEVVALLGRNGMGKTTLMHAVCGIEPPFVTHGTIRFADRNLDGVPSHERTRLGLALVPQGRRIFPSLNVEENLRIGEQPDRGDWDLDAVYELFPRLAERRTQSGGVLSGGEQQMLALGRALMTNPQLLLMDEPSEGLAPSVVQLIEDRLHQLKVTSLAVLLAEQNVDLALGVADRVAVIGEDGVVSWSGHPQRLRDDPGYLRQLVGV